VAVRCARRAPGGRPAATSSREIWPLLPLAAVAMVYAPIALRASLSVPTDWDGLSYHLLYPIR